MSAANFPWLSVALEVRDGSRRRSTSDAYLAALTALRDQAQAEISRICSGTAESPPARAVGHIQDEWRSGA